MKEIFRLGAFLMAVCIIAALGVSYVNQLTDPIIELRNQEIALAGLQEVYPDADEIINESDLYHAQIEKNDFIKEIYKAYIEGNEVGAIYSVSSPGYSGNIDFFVGFDLQSSQITNIKILSQTETPGLGALCEESWFAERFAGLTTERELKVVKHPVENSSEVEAITASTITTKAVTVAVNAARNHFVHELLGQK